MPLPYISLPFFAPLSVNNISAFSMQLADWCNSGTVMKSIALDLIPG